MQTTIEEEEEEEAIPTLNCIPNTPQATHIKLHMAHSTCYRPAVFYRCILFLVMFRTSNDLKQIMQADHASNYPQLNHEEEETKKYMPNTNF